MLPSLSSLHRTTDTFDMMPPLPLRAGPNNGPNNGPSGGVAALDQDMVACVACEEHDKAFDMISKQLLDAQNDTLDDKEALVALKGQVDALRHCKLSFRSFHVDDLALFLPTSPSSRRTYLAFHLGCPHRYLSEESISPVLPSTSTDLSSSRETGKYQDFIVGKIVFIDKHVACREHNPYHLPLDTVFFTLMVTSYNISEGA